MEGSDYNIRQEINIAQSNLQPFKGTQRRKTAEGNRKVVDKPQLPCLVFACPAISSSARQKHKELRVASMGERKNVSPNTMHIYIYIYSIV